MNAGKRSNTLTASPTSARLYGGNTSAQCNGVLHMGHTLNETVQDILVRKARMSGFNACWVPGSDHASIATEAKVVQMLKEKGIDKMT